MTTTDAIYFAIWLVAHNLWWIPFVIAGVIVAVWVMVFDTPYKWRCI